MKRFLSIATAMLLLSLMVPVNLLYAEEIQDAPLIEIQREKSETMIDCASAQAVSDYEKWVSQIQSVFVDGKKVSFSIDDSATYAGGTSYISVSHPYSSESRFVIFSKGYKAAVWQDHQVSAADTDISLNKKDDNTNLSTLSVKEDSVTHNFAISGKTDQETESFYKQVESVHIGDKSVSFSLYDDSFGLGEPYELLIDNPFNSNATLKIKLKNSKIVVWEHGVLKQVEPEKTSEEVLSKKALHGRFQVRPFDNKSYTIELIPGEVYSDIRDFISSVETVTVNGELVDKKFWTKEFFDTPDLLNGGHFYLDINKKLPEVANIKITSKHFEDLYLQSDTTNPLRTILQSSVKTPLLEAGLKSRLIAPNELESPKENEEVVAGVSLEFKNSGVEAASADVAHKHIVEVFLPRSYSDFFNESSDKYHLYYREGKGDGWKEHSAFEVYNSTDGPLLTIETNHFSEWVITLPKSNTLPIADKTPLSKVEKENAHQYLPSMLNEPKGYSGLKGFNGVEKLAKAGDISFAQNAVVVSVGALSILVALIALRILKKEIKRNLG